MHLVSRYTNFWDDAVTRMHWDVRQCSAVSAATAASKLRTAAATDNCHLNPVGIWHRKQESARTRTDRERRVIFLFSNTNKPGLNTTQGARQRHTSQHPWDTSVCEVRTKYYTALLHFCNVRCLLRAVVIKAPLSHYSIHRIAPVCFFSSPVSGSQR